MTRPLASSHRVHAPAVLLVSLALAALGCAADIIPAVHSEPERLALAHRLADRRQWSAAIELLKTYVDHNAGSAQVDEAIYLLGECELRSKAFPEAGVDFERLLRDYPESDSSGSAAFRLGEALFGQARPPDFDQEFALKALEQWQKYLRDYPGHCLNAEAERRIATTRARLAGKLIDTARLYLKLLLAEPARVYFKLVDDRYGDTPVAGEAWIGLAQCEAIEGHHDQAIARLKDLEARFPGQPLGARAARERERIEHMRARAKPAHESHRVPEPVQ
jgi:outer membrane protein assembly factor BamD